MFFHQAHNSVGNDIYNAFFYKNIEWRLHLHKSYEVAIVLEGKAELTLGNKSFSVAAGNAALISPYQLHSYKTNVSSLVFVVVFSGEYIDAFSRPVCGKEADNGVFALSENTLDFIKHGLFTADYDGGEAVAAPKPELLTIKACLYAFAAEAYEKLSFVDRQRSVELLYDMISFVENNYMLDISLKDMAGELGYDYRYLSRVFNETMGVGFKTFVNQYRCDMVKSLMGSSSHTLSQIALDSGFQSIRSFNRVFKQATGCAPSDFFKGWKAK